MSLEKLATPDLNSGLRLISLYYRPFAAQADNATTQFMGLWAATLYHVSFTSLSFQAPFSLTFWQHAYTLNALLIIQETADTFGLLCLGLLFVGSQVFSRNSMLSVFLLLQSSTLESSSSTSLSPNNTKRLTYASTTWSYLLKLCTQPLRVVQSRLRNDSQTLK